MIGKAQRGEPGNWEYLAFWAYGEIDLGETLHHLPATDDAAATMLVLEFPDRLHYATGSKCWYLWDGRCHRPDDADRVGRLIVGFGKRLRHMLDQARQAVNAAATASLPPTASQAAQKHAFDEEWNKGWAAAEKYAGRLANNAGKTALAGYLETLAAYSDDNLADRHPEWLNVANGTVDLRTGAIKPHDPADMITYCLEGEYRPELAWGCSEFLGLVHRMAGGVGDVAQYVLRAAGCSLLGHNDQQEIWFLNGPTKSGKSQFLEVLGLVLGNAMATSSRADLITHIKSGRNARVESSIRGRRIVTISETSERMHIDEGQLKMITGESVVYVDRHYETERLSTAVTWSIWVATNQMPSVSKMDGAIRERMVVIPCGETIPREQRIKGLSERIAERERDAVLSLLVYFAGVYLREGLPQPAEVVLASETYCSDQQTVANYVAEQLVTGMIWGEALIGTEVLESYRGWCERRYASPLGRNDFYTELARVPGVAVDKSGSQFMVRGVRWMTGASAYS